MTFPVATKKTAFWAGLSLSATAVLFDVLHSRGLISFNADSPTVFPFLLVYFFVTVLVFVVDVRSIAPKELKTKIPFVYFPTNREGLNFLLRGWGRMLVWFLGAVAGTALSIPFKLHGG